MKVSELVTDLQSMDQDAEVKFGNHAVVSGVHKPTQEEVDAGFDTQGVVFLQTQGVVFLQTEDS